MRIPDQRLSANFHLSELCRSETAARAGIDNTPPPAVIERLRHNAAQLERVRYVLGTAVLVSSGFRCEDLERLLTGRDFKAWCLKHGKDAVAGWPEYYGRKQHPKGLATDFTAPAYGSPMAVAQAIAASNIDFDQLIYEHTWVHVGWAEPGQAARRQALTLTPTGYAQGIVERALA